ncbi:MAG: monovalent cation:proton antiporter-2 (CPA2) family protein [Chromatiales bacterium]|jgi:monovalent cation:proton antiporter-2 (CPA2) family protein
MLSVYLVDIIILLVAAVIAVPLFQAARLGAVPGFLVAGVIVGPSGLGLISNIAEIGHLAEIGVVLLLFVIGIELTPSRLWLMRRYVFGLGSLQLLFTGVLLGMVSYFFFDNSLRASILVGPAMALSSTAFVLQLLNEQKLLPSLYGRASLAVLLLQDLAVVPLLVLVPLLALPEMSIGEDIGLALGESVLILGFVVVIGRHFLHPILYRVASSGNPEVFTASAVLIVLGAAVATEHAGLSMAMGAFLAGLLISDSSYKHQVLAEIRPFRGLLLGLFFMSMGMSLNLNLLLEKPLLSLSWMALLIGLKAAALFPLALLFGLRLKNSIAIALVLAQSGEFALVLFSLAYQSALFTEALFQQLLLVVLLSMLATPVLAQVAYRLIKKKEEDAGQSAEPPVEAPIVLAGFGRVGHRIGEILTSAGKSYVAMDSSARVVEKERNNGHPVFYGDVREPQLLKTAGAMHAEVIIVTLNDAEATQEVVASLRKAYPQTRIFARGHSLTECRKLYQLGATGVVSENIEASLELARLVMMSVGVGANRRDEILGDFRRSYNAQMNDVSALAKTASDKKQPDNPS